MPATIRKYGLWVHLATLILGTFLLAHLLAFQVERWLRVPPEASRAPVPRVTQEKGSPVTIDPQVILDRNLFGMEIEAPAASAPRPIRSRPDPSSSGSTTPVHLVGTVVGETPRDSYAVVEDPKTREEQIFRVGEEIQPGVELVAVHRNAITVRRGGHLEEIQMTEETGKSSTRLARRHRPPPIPPRAQGVEEAAPQHFVVDKEEVEAALQDINRLMTQARVVPNFTGGKADGFRIFSIVPGSLYDRAGLRNGDIIQRINGVDLDSPEKAMEIFQLLRDNDTFTIDLVRAGKRMTLTYEIR